MFPPLDLNSFDQRIECIEMHTGGEPLRVIVAGFPETRGETVLQRRRDCQQRWDTLRKRLINEPRGHADMYAALLVPPNPTTSGETEAHFGVIFMHNAGYSTMCGHATIALAKLAVHAGWVDVDPNHDETEIRIDAPCGRVTAFVSNAPSEMPVRFIGVPSFCTAQNQSIELPEWGPVKFDISYGGAFYAYVDVAQRAWTLDRNHYETWIRFGRDLKNAIIGSEFDVRHPQESDLSFLYGTIFVGPPHSSKNQSRNICVFADGEVDRCPTGSGVCGRLALHHSKNEVGIDQPIRVESIIGSVFEGRVLAEKDYYGVPSVIPEVRGDAFITGTSSFVLDPADPLAEGFLLR